MKVKHYYLCQILAADDDDDTNKNSFANSKFGLLSVETSNETVK